MEEVWKPIPNFEGLYEVSNLGRVKAFLIVVYVIVAINLFEWCFDVNNFDKSKGE